MKAIICNKWCKPEDLKVLEVASPKLELDSVRIDVHAAGVNFPDVLIIQGKYQYKPEFPFSPGSEVSGIITEIGTEVKNFNVGDRVMAVTGHGAFAEEICVSESKLTKLPIEMDYITAASMSLGGEGHRLDSDGVKLFSTTASKEIADSAIQVMGGYGYVSEYIVERLWRDSKLLEIGGGTIESHQKNITRDLSKTPEAIDQ